MEHFLVGVFGGAMAMIPIISFGYNAFGIGCAAFIALFTPFIYQSFKE